MIFGHVCQNTAPKTFVFGILVMQTANALIKSFGVFLEADSNVARPLSAAGALG